MKISSNGIEFRSWQVVLLAMVAVVLIVAITANNMYSKTIELQDIEATQAEKTDRGHWLWGTSTETEVTRTQSEEDGKSDRGHWLWGHWDDVAEKEEGLIINSDE